MWRWVNGEFHFNVAPVIAYHEFPQLPDPRVDGGYDVE